MKTEKTAKRHVFCVFFVFLCFPLFSLVFLCLEPKENNAVFLGKPMFSGEQPRREPLLSDGAGPLWSKVPQGPLLPGPLLSEGVGPLLRKILGVFEGKPMKPDEEPQGPWGDPHF